MMGFALPLKLCGRRAALVVAHPGHEVRLHGWLELARPRVWVLTDGSGHGEAGRVGSTASLLAKAGATSGGWFGRLSDRQAYEAILDGDVSLWTGLVEELAASLVDDEIDYVVADAWEGFNPVHDMCRVLVDSAIGIARGHGRPSLASYGFPLDADPGAQTPGLSAESVLIELDEIQLERKLTAALAYSELTFDVESALAAWGKDAFRREVLRPTVEGLPWSDLASGPLYYETHGERRVEAGHYQKVLRFREHFLPLAEQLATISARVEAASACES